MNRASLLTVPIFALLICAPAWSQSYGTSASGSATACGETEPYNVSGPLKSVGTIGPIQCGLEGLAAADSHVFLLVGKDVKQSYQAGGIAVRAGAGVAKSEAFDSVTLLPPSTYPKLWIVVTLTDLVQVSVAGTASGRATFTWEIPPVWKHSSTSTASDDVVEVFHVNVSRASSADPFEFQIKKTVTSSASAPTKNDLQSLKYSTWSTPEVELPYGKNGGWICTYASGRACKDY